MILLKSLRSVGTRCVSSLVIPIIPAADCILAIVRNLFIMRRAGTDPVSTERGQCQYSGG